MTRAKLALNKSKFIRSTLFHCFVVALLAGFVKTQNEESTSARSVPYAIGALAEEAAKVVFEEGDAIIPVLEHKNIYRTQIPKFFDARKHWSTCSSIIDYRRDQGRCQSCWAESTASAIGDRICIETKGKKKMIVSSEDIVSCCRSCMTSKRCAGYGYARHAHLYWQNVGVVSGGICLPINKENKYFAEQGCKPYSPGTYQGKAPRCKKQCTNSKYSTSYKQDKAYGRIVYTLKKRNPRQIQRDIHLYGPVVALMQVYTDLRNYTSGVYESNRREKDYMHFIKIIGWGVERNKPYWLIANSYGRDWGEKGLFRLLRGNNHCGIENFIVTGRSRKINVYREALSSRCCSCTEFMAAIVYEFLLVLLVLKAS